MSDSIRTGMLKVDTCNSCPWLEVRNTLSFVLAGREPFFLIWVFHTFVFSFYITYMGTSVSVALQNFTFSVLFFFDSLSLKGMLQPRGKKSSSIHITRMKLIPKQQKFLVVDRIPLMYFAIIVNQSNLARLSNYAYILLGPVPYSFGFLG